MAVRIGTNPIAWSNDDMRELGADIPLETCLAQARDAGFAGIELGHKFPREAAPLGAILETHRIGLVGGWYSTELQLRTPTEEIAAMAGHLALLKALGCTVFILAETHGAVHGAAHMPLSRTPVLADGDWKRFGQRMTEVCAYLRD